MTKPKTITHGASAYAHSLCHCNICRTAHTARIAQRRAIRASRFVPEHVVHGASCYKNWLCRCAICAAGNAAACKEYRQRRKHNRQKNQERRQHTA